MKLRKIFNAIFTTLFILAVLSFAACKQSKLTITKPGQDVSLLNAIGKVQDGFFTNRDGTSIGISSGGNNITIKDSGGSEVGYIKKEAIGESEKIWIYENTNSSSTGNEKNMLVMGTDSSTITVAASEKGINAVKKSFDYFGEEKSLNIVMDMQKPEYQNADGSPNTDKIAEKYNMNALDKTNLNGFFKNITKGDFGDSKTYNKTS